MKPGIKTFGRLPANQQVVSSIVPVPINGLGIAVTAGQRIHVRAWIPFDAGAGTGGIRFQMSAPGSNAGNERFTFIATPCDPATIPADAMASQQGANTPMNGGWDDLGDSVIAIEGDYVATVDGTLTPAFAQNISSTTPIVIFEGAFIEATLY